MDCELSEHGLVERRTHAAAVGRHLLISPNGMAHFSECPHKGDNPDYSRWTVLDTPQAWERLGNGEELKAIGGENPKPDSTDEVPGLQQSRLMVTRRSEATV